MKLTDAVHKYKWGDRQWRVVSWSPRYQAWEESPSMGYWEAIGYVRTSRADLEKTGEYKDW